jgi:Tol biopolymer transport system component/DNA-binding winged helix-turn-helix (wHTH) protein
MPGTSGQLFRFGEFELDVDAYVLRHAGQPVKLEQQPMDLLILLVQRCPAMVTRAEIATRLWGAETFVEAENGINTAVRKVRQALGDSAASPRFIERIPGKGYRFAAEAQAGDQPSGRRQTAAIDHASRAAWRPMLLTGAVAASLCAVAFAVWDFAPRAAGGPASLHVEPLTRLQGSERDSTLSPDGRQVAFSWDTEREDNFDIYVMLVGSAQPVRLTTDPGADLAPQWSPDGRHIAYVRVRPPGRSHQLRVMSAVGGDDRAVSEFPAWYQSSWSPDGRYLAAGRAVDRTHPTALNGIYLVPIDGGEPRMLTQPPSGSDYSPAFSHDGSQLAYTNCRDLTFRFDCHVMVLSLDAQLQPRGAPRRLTAVTHRRVAGVAWSRDDASVLYGAGGPTGRLWRVAAAGSEPPRIIEEAGEGAAYPATARASDRVIYSQASFPNDIYRLDFGGAPRPIAQSTGLDGQPDYSSDGRRIAFCSNRSGPTEVWIATSDGAAPVQLTRGPGRESCSPSWSPDDRTIAYDSVDDEGYWQVWTIGSDGEAPRKLTSGRVDHNVPRWSRDGQWIYFSAAREGARDIWRMHLTSGEAAQVTTGGSGFWSQESPDRTGIVYAASNGQSPLLFQAYAGGPARQLLPCLAAGSIVATTPEGVYYLPCLKEPAADQPLRLFDPATTRDRLIGTLEEYYRPRDFYAPSFRKISLSRDARALLYTHRRPATANLLWIDGFR